MDTNPNMPTSVDFTRNPFGERYLYDVDRALFATERAEEVFARRLDVDFAADDTLFVVVGSDSGLLFEHLRRQPLGRGSRRLVVEADHLHALIEGAVETDDGTDDDAAATLCRFGDWREALHACGPDGFAHGGTIRVVESLGCLYDHAGCYVSMLRDVKGEIARLTHHWRIQVAGQRFIRAQMHNACENVLPASTLRGVGEGATAMVIGGGPSLDAAIDWVVANRERLFLIAVSRVCDKLQRLGLRPDVVVAVDPQDGLYDISKQGLSWEDTPLVSSYHVSPPLLHQWRGPRLYLGPLFPWKTSDDPSGDNVLSVGPTVSHAGAWLAYEWGFERILMTGVDMCFSVGGGSHAGGSVEEMIGALPSQCDVSVRTYAGRTAGTSMGLQHGAEQLEALGRRVNANGARLFNVSADAARIESVPFVELSSVALSGDRPVLSLPDERLLRRAHLERVLDVQKEARRRFGAIRRRCAEALRLIDAMAEARDRGRHTTHQRKLDRLRKALDREHGAWFDVIKEYASAELLASVKPSGFRDVEAEEQEGWLRGYFRIVRRTAGMFLERLDDCDARTAMRLAELDPEPDVEALLDYWASDATPGRVLLRTWSGGTPGIPAPAPATSSTARVAAARHDFLATLEERDTGYVRRIRKRYLDPANVLRNLAFLFKERAAEDLAALATRLQALETPNDVLGIYAEGLLAELGEDPAAPLSHYQQVIERFGTWLESEEGIPERLGALLEDVLQRITRCHLASGDGESAVGSLGLLAQLSPAHAPRHAHLLHLLGRHDEALGALEAHVRAAPEDWRALLQLADIYAALQADDAADMARRLAAKVRHGDGFEADVKAA